MDVHERVASEPIDVRISKALAAVLRHGKMGFTLDDEGFLAVDSILTHPYFIAQKCHFEDLKRISVNPVDGIKNSGANLIKKNACDGKSLKYLLTNFPNIQNHYL